MIRSLQFFTLLILSLLVIAFSVNSYTYEIDEQIELKSHKESHHKAFPSLLDDQDAVILGEIIEDHWPLQ